MIDPVTQAKCVQTKAKDVDDGQIENNPGLFAAEQTWPTMDELKRPQRKGSLEEEDQM